MHGAAAGDGLDDGDPARPPPVSMCASLDGGRAAGRPSSLAGPTLTPARRAAPAAAGAFALALATTIPILPLPRFASLRRLYH